MKKETRKHCDLVIIIIPLESFTVLVFLPLPPLRIINRIKYPMRDTVLVLAADAMGPQLSHGFSLLSPLTKVYIFNISLLTDWSVEGFHVSHISDGCDSAG